jgi:hypothetical protein
VETDASDFAIGAVLSGVIDAQLNPIAFYSGKMVNAEINNHIHETELLTTVAALKEWRGYLKGSLYQIQLKTDHKYLEYATSTQISNRL